MKCRTGLCLASCRARPHIWLPGQASLTRRRNDWTVRIRQKPVMNLLLRMAGLLARAGCPSSPYSPHERCTPHGVRPEKRMYHA